MITLEDKSSKKSEAAVSGRSEQPITKPAAMADHQIMDAFREYFCGVKLAYEQNRGDN